jgi:hypothetical protein
LGPDRTAGDAIIPALSVRPHISFLHSEAVLPRAEQRRVETGNSRNRFQKMVWIEMNVELWDVAIRLRNH